MMLSEKTEEDPSNNFGFVVEGILLLIIALLGVLGNLLCIIAFSVKRNKNTFHHLMLGKIQYNIRGVVLCIHPPGLDVRIETLTLNIKWLLMLGHDHINYNLQLVNLN